VTLVPVFGTGESLQAPFAPELQQPMAAQRIAQLGHYLLVCIQTGYTDVEAGFVKAPQSLLTHQDLPAVPSTAQLLLHEKTRYRSRTIR